MTTSNGPLRTTAFIVSGKVPGRLTVIVWDYVGVKVLMRWEDCQGWIDYSTFAAGNQSLFNRVDSGNAICRAGPLV
jgi:hypothetical protein